MSSNAAMTTLAGLAASRGLVSAPVFLYLGEGEIPVAEYAVPVGGEAEEMARFNRARMQTRRDLEGLVAALRARAGDARVLECHLMILDDPALVAEADGYVVRDHLNAGAAVKRTAANAREKFARMNDPYFRERVRDLDDVERRLLRVIAGCAAETGLELKSPCIVVADNLSPSETVALPPEFTLGIATNGGSTTSHVALLARAMGIPAVVGLGDVTDRVSAGETILLDGTSGAVTLHPDAKARAEFEALVARQAAAAPSVRDIPPPGTLADGGDIPIYANVHPGVPVAAVREFGARGIGLYRSEYLWLNGEREPDEEEQFAAYRDAAQFTATLSDKATLTIRTLDVGGDKLVRGLMAPEENPFLGHRSIRYQLEHRDMLRTQLRAILRASAYGRICLLFPMISCVEEIREVKAELAAVRRQLELEGVAFDRRMPVGIMIEVPSAALVADALAREVDFFSIGTNDLVQYTMAADRGNEYVAHLYQPTNPAVVELVRRTVSAARKRGIHVGVCGESAADPVVGVLWAAMGVDLLSMSAGYIPQIASVLRRLTKDDLAELALTAAGTDCGATAAEVLAACRAWIVRKIPDFDELMK